MNRRRQRSRDDLTLWQRAMRDVRPLRARPKTKTAKPPPGPEAAPLSAGPAPAKPRPAAPALPKIGGHRAPGLDKSSAEKLKRGRYTIERRLDLHGMTQEAAHRALAGFIARAA